MRWSLGVVVVVGCGVGTPDEDDATPVDPCLTEDIQFSPGTGAEAYEPLEDGDHVTMVHGPQGGWHVETAGLLEHSEFDVSVVGTLMAPDLGIEVTNGQQPVFIALVHDEDSCTGSFYGVRTYVGVAAGGGADDQLFVCGLEGQRLTFSLDVAEIAGGRAATTEVEVIADLDPDDVPLCQ